MRLNIALLAFVFTAAAQEQAAPAPAAAEQPPAPVVEQQPPQKVDVAPLAPPDMTSPYASPRDSARHRFQTAMTDLPVNRDIKAGIRELAEAFATDPSYAPAAFNLGLLCAVAGKWQDAVAALTQAVRLDPGQFRALAEPQLERLRLIATLESTPEGQRARRYDEALYALLQRWKEVSQSDAAATLVQIGRVDPRRWEAPSLLAGLLGDGRNYEAAVQFLEIAAANASDALHKAALQKAVAAAQREIRYGRARRDAEIASEKGEYDKAAQMYEAAWKEMPARADSGMFAASAFLLTDDTARASGVLHRLQHSPDKSLSVAAAARLKRLEPIEPAAKVSGSSSDDFFRDAGPVEPVRIAELVPVMDKKRMEILARPLPRMVLDPAAVTLLESLAADRAPGSLPPSLPPVSAARLAGERPWSEIQQVVAAPRAATPAPFVAEQSRQVAQLGTARVKRTLAIETTPPGAALYFDGAAEPACTSPCDVQIAPGAYVLRAAIEGYEPQLSEVRVASARVDVNLTLERVRGRVIIEAPATAALEVNGQPLPVSAPVEIAVAPGLYKISAGSGAGRREQTVTVRPSARLRLNLGQ